mmetsp:Transcript_14750/g.26089  ORF Transcript_14750/g.26089 Transcript_14750/m.26089 type:complete len:216 (+) Transcript_14750:478-1125(+)
MIFRISALLASSMWFRNMVRLSKEVLNAQLPSLFSRGRSALSKLRLPSPLIEFPQTLRYLRQCWYTHFPSDRRTGAKAPASTHAPSSPNALCPKPRTSTEDGTSTEAKYAAGKSASTIASSPSTLIRLPPSQTSFSVVLQCSSPHLPCRGISASASAVAPSSPMQLSDKSSFARPSLYVHFPVSSIRGSSICASATAPAAPIPALLSRSELMLVG